MSRKNCRGGGKGITARVAGLTGAIACMLLATSADAKQNIRDAFFNVYPDAMGTMASVLRVGSGRLPACASTRDRNMGSSMMLLKSSQLVIA